MGESFYKQLGPYVLVDRIDEAERRDRWRAIGLRQDPSLHFLLRTYSAPDGDALAQLRATLKASVAAARDFEHPNLCAPLTAEDMDGGAYTVYSAIAGKPLSRVLDELRSRGMRLPVPVVLYIAHQLCAGLSFAHTVTDRAGRPRGLTFAALGPGTVLLGYEGEVRIVEALPLPGHLATATAPGADPAYLSPERAMDLRPEGRSDLFTIGILLYECLTHRSPFRRANPIDSRAAVLNSTLLSPSELHVAIDRRLDALVMKALAREPKDRFGDAWELEEALLELCGAVEMRRARATLAGILATVFGDDRESERLALRTAVEVLSREGRFDRSIPPGERSKPPRAAPPAPESMPPIPSALPSLRQTPPPDPPPRAAPRESTSPSPQAELPKLAPLPETPRVSAHGEARVSAHGEARVSAHGQPRVSAHGEARPTGQRGQAERTRQWTLLSMGLGGLALIVLLYGALRSDDAARATLPGQTVVDQLDATDAQAGAGPGWEAILEGSPAAYARARVALERAVAADPQDPEALAGLAVVYADARDPTAFRGVEAAELLARIDALAPGHLAGQQARAAMQLGEHDDAGAVATSRLCLTEHPDDPRCAWFQGLGLRGLGRYAQALAALEQSVRGRTPGPEATATLGEVARQAGEPARARRALEKGLEAHPRDPALHVAMAGLLAQIGDYPGALAHYEQAAPDNLPAQLARGALLDNALDRPADAAGILAPLAVNPRLATDPMGVEVLTRAAWSLVAADRAAEALPLARKARERAPEDTAAGLALALALEATGDAEGARSIVGGLSFHGPDPRLLARLRWHAAALLLRNGRERFAAPLLEEALQSDPRWAPAQLLLAEVRWRTGDPAGALALLGQVAEPEPDPRDPLGLAPPVRYDPGPLLAEIPAGNAEELRARGVLQAVACTRADSCAEARATLGRAVAADPADEASALLFSRLLLREGQAAAALAPLEALTRRGSPGPALSLGLALAHEAVGDHSAADAAFAAALSGEPRPSWLRAYALALAARGEAEAARAAARKALALDPSDTPCLALLAR